MYKIGTEKFNQTLQLLIGYIIDAQEKDAQEKNAQKKMHRKRTLAIIRRRLISIQGGSVNRKAIKGISGTRHRKF